MSSIEFEIGDDLYEVEVRSFDAVVQGNRRGNPDRWTPDEGGEIELEETVKVWVYDPKRPDQLFSDRDTVKISLNSFVAIYAKDRGIQKMSTSDTLAAARAELDEECIEKLQEKMEDDFDDRDY